MPDGPEQQNQDQTDADNGDVWQRLREHVKTLRSIDSEASDPAALAKRLAHRAQILRHRMQRPDMEVDRQSFLLFNKQQERYGIPLDDVASVESLEHFTPVPNAADFIRGVTPWRGSILSLIDLGRLFGRYESGIADLRTSVIVDIGSHRLAIAAFEVEEIVAIAPSELAASPGLPAEIAPEWIMGIYDENRLILRTSELIKGIAVGRHSKRKR